MFKVKSPSYSTSSTNYAYLYLAGTQVDSSNARYYLGSRNTDFSVSKSGSSYATTGYPFYHTITVSGSEVTDLYVDDIFPKHHQLLLQIS